MCVLTYQSVWCVCAVKSVWCVCAVVQEWCVCWLTRVCGVCVLSNKSVWCACGLSTAFRRPKKKKMCVVCDVWRDERHFCFSLSVSVCVCVCVSLSRGTFVHHITACMSISGGSACRIEDEDVSEGRIVAVPETSWSLEEESRLACALSLRGCVASVPSLLPLRATVPTPAAASHELTGRFTRSV